MASVGVDTTVEWQVSDTVSLPAVSSPATTTTGPNVRDNMTYLSIRRGECASHQKSQAYQAQVYHFRKSNPYLMLRSSSSPKKIS